MLETEPFVEAFVVCMFCESPCGNACLEVGRGGGRIRVGGGWRNILGGRC